MWGAATSTSLVGSIKHPLAIVDLHLILIPASARVSLEDEAVISRAVVLSAVVSVN
jgi:hypothetical protein